MWVRSCLYNFHNESETIKKMRQIVSFSYKTQENEIDHSHLNRTKNDEKIGFKKSNYKL